MVNVVAALSLFVHVDDKRVLWKRLSGLHPRNPNLVKNRVIMSAMRLANVGVELRVEVARCRVNPGWTLRIGQVLVEDVEPIPRHIEMRVSNGNKGVRIRKALVAVVIEVLSREREDLIPTNVGNLPDALRRVDHEEVAKLQHL